jgi:hypothetical protein
MLHIAEMVLLFLLLALCQGAVNPARNMGRRVVVSFGLWTIAFAAIIAAMYSPDISAWIVRIAICALIAYCGRALLGMVFDVFTASRLFEAPDIGHLAVAVEQISGVPETKSRKLCRRLTRTYGGDLALLGLVMMIESGDPVADEFEAHWREKCDAAREETESLAMRYGSHKDEKRIDTADATLLVQAQCLYERRAVLKALSAHPIGTKVGRKKFVERLDKQGDFHVAAEAVGLIMPASGPGSATTDVPGTNIILRLTDVIVPAYAYLRLGFRKRAIILGMSEFFLLTYAAYGACAILTNGQRLGLDFVINAAPGIYLATAVVMHIQAVFALEEFGRLAHYLQLHRTSGAKKP